MQPRDEDLIGGRSGDIANATGERLRELDKRFRHGNVRSGQDIFGIGPDPLGFADRCEVAAGSDEKGYKTCDPS